MEQRGLEKIERVSAEESYRKAASGEALLICAYEDSAACDRMRLEFSIDMQEFRSRRKDIPRDKELIFYCG